MTYPTSSVVMPQPLNPLHGNAFYDSAVQRWVPVGPNQVSPDGLQLAYAEYDMAPGFTYGMADESRPRSTSVVATTGRVHLVDVRTGVDKIIYSGAPTYAVAGFTSAGIYLTQITLTMDGPFSSGLYLIAPSGDKPTAVPGGARQLDRDGWTIGTDGAAWASEFTPGAGNPGRGNEVVRLDLNTGAVTTWLTEPAGVGATMIGLDTQGHPLVTSAQVVSSGGTPAPSQLLELTAPQHATVLWQTSDPNTAPPYGPVFDDSHGAWMGDNGAVWLDANGKITTVAVLGGVDVGGTCQ